MNKVHILGIVMIVLLAFILLASGVLIGRQWQEPQVFTIGSALQTTDSVNQPRLGNVITVQGEGIVELEPEIARLYLEVEFCNADANVANLQVNIALANVSQGLQTVGVPDSNIVPTEFSLYPRYASLNREKITGFCASNHLVVQTDDLQDVSNLLDQAIEAGVNQVHRVVFTVEDKGTAREDAIRLAYIDAKSQAEQLAKLMGHSLGPTLNSEIQVSNNLSNHVTGYFGGGGAVTPREGKMQATVTLVYAVGE